MAGSRPVIGPALVSKTVLHLCLKSSGPVLEIFHYVMPWITLEGNGSK